MNDAWLRRLGIRLPLLQAGMGGIAGPALAAAVAEAGAGGIVAMYRLPGPAVARRVRETRALTAAPFGVNLIPELQTESALAAQVQAALAADARVFFSIYGLPPASLAATVRDAGRALVVMVGTPEDALEAERRGADVVVLQGVEAGGHLLGDWPLQALLQASQAAGCRAPLVAAGGIAHGAAWRTLQRRGAAGCLCGTLFVCTTESEAHPHYQRRLLAADAHDTVVSRAFETGWPGRAHRVLRVAAAPHTQAPPGFVGSVLIDGRRHPLPRHCAMVPTMHTTGRIDEMAMYCGTGVGALSEVLPAAQRIERFFAEARSVPYADPATTVAERGCNSSTA
ncbi:NAD(P)H-dependent flavin oxidoreductase [Aquabacterium humicola]|uniref:NAD(P)H-dependent flavin oxidoreductase n=1 Tax=Aquabacterium humicola TaxID=3237377 RepID=UPI0025439233|nr:nitronate monooxygenase [Rubrivivax pictus]